MITENELAKMESEYNKAYAEMFQSFKKDTYGFIKEATIILPLLTKTNTPAMGMALFIMLMKLNLDAARNEAEDADQS